MSVTIVTGGFWGDEGKGKVVAYLALTDRPPVIARAGVGPNAGHTIFVDGQRYVLRQIPVGFVHRAARLLIGAGVLVDPEVLLAEVGRLAIAPERLGVDRACTVIEPHHRQEDQASDHLRQIVGSTGTGTGPANAGRVNRTARLARDEERLLPYLADVAAEVNGAADHQQDLLIEGTQGFGLSLYHGDYPFVTSKDTTAAACCMDVGIGPTRVTDVIVVLKAYASRVGNGPMPTELPEAEATARGWEEVGAVTGRQRRIGEFDFAHAARAIMVNGATSLALTNLDRRFPAAAGCTEWRRLPTDARAFTEMVEERLDRPVTLVSTGADVDEMIDRRH
jgi:adenylosuccinate synthase